MNIDAALRRYRKGMFADHDVTRCTGLSVRSWRQLVKVGAVRTITEDRGRGRIRLCNATSFKRAAVIAALNRAGSSLVVSGRIAYFLPLDEVFYACCDPSNILLHVSADVDPNTGLPPRLERPKTDWFDPNKPAKRDPENDLLIEIYDGRFVGVNCATDNEPAIFGDLRNDGTSFVCWFPFHRQKQFFGGTTEQLAPVMPYNIGDFIAKWEDTWSDRLDPDFLDYHFEDHDADNDPLVIAAVAAAQNPVLKTTINVTLALRKTLRRYLGIEQAVPNSEMG